MDQERRRPPDREPPTPSSLLRDVSNYKTPRPPNPKSNASPVPIFFTASKATPRSTSSAGTALRRHSSVAAKRRLRALEIEQSQSSRKAQLLREKALKSFSKSVSAWLNFLFRNPRSCGCNYPDAVPGDQRRWGLSPNKKRESLDWGGEVGVGGRWRSPKRQRGEGAKRVTSGAFASLEASLKEICSLEDLRERMGIYMSEKACEEVLTMMSQVCKNIDEGRLKMKEHCPLVTDLRLKEKATRVLLSYNPLWLRIGLHIIFGGDSLILNNGENADQEYLFLKMIIEKQFFCHMGLKRSYAYNKLVEGLYRPGYYDALGNIILKRFLLLVISLDKAKCESTLPLKYGIDGIDGGSAILFSRLSHIKSSRQVIHGFLSEVMLGEGDLLAHLAIVGCKVNHQQLPLSDYEFTISNLCEDLQDGILLSRAIQLLQCDASILSKVVVPSDTRKRNLQNCSIAIHYLKQAGVPLSDADGVTIVAEDVANGDIELMLSILWNMFVHLQVPLLVNRSLLVEEISKIKGHNLNSSNCNSMTEMALLLGWIQAVCDRYGVKVDGLSSLVDGKSMCCLINYYVTLGLSRCHASEEDQGAYTKELLRFSDAGSATAVQNFMLLQTVAAISGSFPEVGHILHQDGSCDERSVIILLVFLTPQLINKRNLEQLIACSSAWSSYQTPNVKPLVTSQLPFSGKHQAIDYDSRERNVLEFDSPVKQGVNNYNTADAVNKTMLIQNVWRTHSKRSSYIKIKLAACVLQAAMRCHLGKKYITDMRQAQAARVIQSQFRAFTARKKFLKFKLAASFIQSAIRAWFVATSKSSFFCTCSLQNVSAGTCDRYLNFMTERHKFVAIKKSVLLLQWAVRIWIRRKHQQLNIASSPNVKYSDMVFTATTVQSYVRGQIARSRNVHLVAQVRKQTSQVSDRGAFQQQCMSAVVVQVAWKRFAARKLYLQQISAAKQIQRNWRCWYMRRNFLYQRKVLTYIQACIRSQICWSTFRQSKTAAIEIQRLCRGQLARRKLLGASYYRFGMPPCVSYDSLDIGSKGHMEMELRIVICSILKIQRWWRRVTFHKSRTTAAILIQAYARRLIAQKRASNHRHSIFIIQRWWRNVFLVKLKNSSAVIIQTHVRGWIARRAACRNKNRIILIQSYWKGYLVRKFSRQQIFDLRCRLKRAAENVDDSKRLINRLVAALAELLGYRSITNIRHTCATLDVATEHSQKCCETLVSAGAINILLKQFHSLNRGVPDQEILKHVLSTLRNIVRYPHLVQVLIRTPHSVEIIFQELLRSKNECFFVACEILKKLCATLEGLEAIHNLQGHVRRLKILAQDLERKMELQKRYARFGIEREINAKKLKEVADLLLLISGKHH